MFKHLVQKRSRKEKEGQSNMKEGLNSKNTFTIFVIHTKTCDGICKELQYHRDNPHVIYS